MLRQSAQEAYVACEDITRQEAKNFYYGIRLLPPAKRSALCSLYALARRIDDIGDCDAPAAERAENLATLRKSLSTIDRSSDPVLAAVSQTARDYPVPMDAFYELVDGVEMDLAGVHYEDFHDLTIYCRRVAGSVGRLCLAIFGSGSDPRAPRFADQLGIALQQTNILRDIREDLMTGRVYLPSAELTRFGATVELDERGALSDPEAHLAEYITFAAARAEHWYDLGLRLLPELDGRSAACCAAMAGIYHHLLRRIRTRPTAVYDGRLSLPTWEKGRVALTALGKAVI